LFILISTKDETSLNREGLSEVIRNKWISDRSYTKKKKMSPTLFYYRLGRTLIWYKKKNPALLKENSGNDVVFDSFANLSCE